MCSNNGVCIGSVRGGQVRIRDQRTTVNPSVPDSASSVLEALPRDGLKWRDPGPAYRGGMNVVAVGGFTGDKTAAAEELPDVDERDQGPVDAREGVGPVLLYFLR